MIDESIYELMEHSFGGAIHTIFIPSLGRSVPFKEPTVRENKLVSKIVIANRDSQSIIYATTLALIKGLCVEKDFDQYSIDEYDRLVILANLFVNNFLSKQLSLRCLSEECKNQFVYTVKHGDLIKAIEAVDTSDIVFKNETDGGDITITINYPTTRQYLDFLEFLDRDSEKLEHDRESNAKNDRYDELNSAFSEIESMQSKDGKAVDIQDVKIAEMLSKRKERAKSESMKSVAGNIDISRIKNHYSVFDSGDLYIKDILYHINGDENEYHIVFDNSINFEDRERILGMFPMSFLTKKDGSSMLDYMTEELDKRLRACVPSIKCPKCGTELKDAIGLHDFFMHG